MQTPNSAERQTRFTMNPGKRVVFLKKQSYELQKSCLRELDVQTEIRRGYDGSIKKNLQW